MKTIYFLIILLASTLAVHAQMTDVQLGQAADTIKYETARNANTAVRIGRMFNNIIDNKVNVNTLYSNPSFVNSLVWSKINSTPTTLSGYGITDAAPLASPALTGTPTAPTAADGTSSTQIATTGYVMSSAPKEYGLACSDLSTALTTGTTKAYFRVPRAMTVTEVRASILTPQTSGSILTIDINESGTSILSTKLTIDNSETTSTTAAATAVISDAALADDAEITIDIDVVGAGGTGLIVWIIGY